MRTVTVCAVLVLVLVLVTLGSVMADPVKVTKPASCIDSGTFEGWCWFQRECKRGDKAASCTSAAKQCGQAAKISKATCHRAHEYSCFAYTFKVEGPTLKRHFPRKEWGKIKEGEHCYRSLDLCEEKQNEQAESSNADSVQPCKLYAVIR